MARHKLPDNQKLREVPAKVTPETIEALRKIADKYDWSVSQVVRKAIVKGLEQWADDLNPAPPQPATLSIEN